MADVLHLPPPSTNLRCACGGEWWRLRRGNGEPGVVTIDAATNQVVAYTLGIVCDDCGEERRG